MGAHFKIDSLLNLVTKLYRVEKTVNAFFNARWNIGQELYNDRLASPIADIAYRAERPTVAECLRLRKFRVKF